MELVKVAVATLGLNYGVHYLSASAYNYFCMPHSIGDVLHSFVTTASPVCSSLIQVTQVTQNNYATVLTATVAAVLAKTLNLKQ